MVLSAGFGTRLRPLTHFLPKPLLPVAGEPLVGSTLRGLGDLGCEVAVLNLHHLGELIRQTLGSSWFGLPLVYSPEDPVQGTLGALAGPRRLLADSDAVLLVNGDSLCHWPWKAMLRCHFATGADATLLLHRHAPDPLLGGGVGVDSKGRVVQLRDAPPVGEVKRRHGFLGAHILSPTLLERVKAEPSDIIADLYTPLLTEGGRISAVTSRRRWHDLGTPDRYLQASLETMHSSWLRRPRRVVSPLAKVAATAKVRHSLVAADAVVEETAEIEASIVLEGARVTSGCRVENSILGPGVVLSPSTHVDHRMINRILTSHPANKEETLLGDLSYIPLER